MGAALPLLLACNLIAHLSTPPATTRSTATPLPPPATLPATPTTPPSLTPTADPPTPQPSPSATLAASRTSQTTVSEETRGPVTLQTTATTIHYFISGTTSEELDAQMRSLGPVDALGGYHWFALTEPLFDWRYECPCADQGCAPGSVTALLTIRTTLPRWAIPPGMESDPLAGQWAAFEAALTVHESGHADLAAMCAWQLGEAIAALPPAGSCAEIDAAVGPATDPVFAACREAQRAYENVTNHGQSQGVIWPPY